MTLNPAPEPLDTQLNGLTERFAPWRMSELRRGYRVVCDVRANWKLVMLNYSECTARSSTPPCSATPTT